MSMMKCISLHQPWASLVVLGAKKFETRSWPTSYRGPLLIHAAKKWNPQLQATCFSDPIEGELYDAGHISNDGLGGKSSWKNPLPFGSIIGGVSLDECYEVVPCQRSPAEAQDPLMDELASASGQRIQLPAGDEWRFGDFGIGRFAWQLSNPRRFAMPIPFCGRQGFFNVPAEVVAEQMESSR